MQVVCLINSTIPSKHSPSSVRLCYAYGTGTRESRSRASLSATTTAARARARHQVPRLARIRYRVGILQYVHGAVDTVYTVQRTRVQSIEPRTLKLNRMYCTREQRYVQHTPLKPASTGMVSA